MKANEIRAMDANELGKQLQSAYQQLFELRLKAHTRQLTNHREIPRLKRQIATILTILRERDLEAAQPPQA